MNITCLHCVPEYCTRSGTQGKLPNSSYILWWKNCKKWILLHTQAFWKWMTYVCLIMACTQGVSIRKAAQNVIGSWGMQESTKTGSVRKTFKEILGFRISKIWKHARRWWHPPLIPTFRRQRQSGLCEVEASLVYSMSTKIVKTILRDFCHSRSSFWDMKLKSTCGQPHLEDATSRVFISGSTGEPTNLIGKTAQRSYGAFIQAALKLHPELLALQRPPLQC